MTFFQDVQYASRALRRARVLTATSVLTLAVGIGAVTAMFSVVDAVLIRSVPFPHASQLMVIWQRDASDPSRIGEVSHYTYRLWQERSRQFTDLAAFGSVNWSFDLTGRGERRAVPFAAVSWRFFRTLGVAPLHGRVLAPDDDRPHAVPVVIVSYGFWQTDLGGDRDVIGQSLMLNGTARTIVGVMPPTFDFPRGASMWAPVVPALAAVSAGPFQALEAPGFGVLYLVGRLREGGAARPAARELVALEREDAAAHGFKDVQIPEPALTAVRDYVSDNSLPALAALGATCVAILLIACMNVSSLLLMRVSSSRHRFAIRTALGASRVRIAREEIAVAGLLGIAGTLAGVFVAALAVRVLRTFATATVPHLGAVQIDGRAVACSAAACLAAVLASGVIPALRAARATSNEILMRRSTTAALSTTRVRNVLVVSQVAAALMLLLMAAVSIRSLQKIRAIDLGFNPDGLVTLNASLPDATQAEQRRFSRELLDAIRALPGVTAAAAVSLRPLQHGLIGNDMSLLLEGQRPFPALDGQKNPIVVHQTITPQYFRTLGSPLLRGRDFNEHDDGAGVPVVILSEALARTLWPGQDTIGKRLQLADAPLDANGVPRWSTVVGVVRDIRYRAVTDQRPDLYVPYSQAPPVSEVMIRTTGRLAPLVEGVRASARRVNPNAHVDGVDTMAAVVADATASWNFNMWLFTVLGLSGLLLAVIGLYGLLAYLVSEKRRELGVRIALGATPGHLARSVTRQALSLTALGLVVGTAAASVLARFVQHVAYEVRPLESTLVTLVCLVLLGVAAAASYVPARRAGAIDPATALRME